MSESIGATLVFVTILATIVIAYDVLTRYFSKLQRRRIDIIDQALKVVGERPEKTIEELLDLWLPITSSHKNSDNILCSAEDIVNLLCSASANDRTLLKPACEKGIHVINSLAEYIDDGLILPIDIIRYRPDVYCDLLKISALVEPYVWYRVIVRKQGRYGLRVNQIRKVFTELLAVYPVSDIKSCNVTQNNVEFISIHPMGAFKRMVLRGIYHFWSPTGITDRSKLQQEVYCKKLQERLKKNMEKYQPRIEPW